MEMEKSESKDTPAYTKQNHYNQERIYKSIGADRMDSAIKSSTWEYLAKSTWKDQAAELIKNRLKPEVPLTISIYLPFLAYKVYNIITDNKLYFDVYNDISKLYKFPNSSEIIFFPMEFCITNSLRGQIIELKLCFPAKVIKGYKDFKSGYYYRWGHNYLTITRWLATTNMDKIEKLAKELLAEGRKFYFMYCTPVNNN